VQLSAVTAHAEQLAPPVPQALAVGVVQTLPAQQPPTQLDASQTQAPATQCCPLAHAAWVPQRHAPPVQLSESAESHGVHAPPLEPQFVVEGVSHVLPLQQPEVHVCAHPSHTWFTQVVPEAHGAQALPPDPHAPGRLPG
jgi:hypothetical protein